MASNDTGPSRMTIPTMLEKLDEMYEKEDALIKQMKVLRIQYQQLQDDKELLQNMIMHQSNKKQRFNNSGIN